MNKPKAENIELVDTDNRGKSASAVDTHCYVYDGFGKLINGNCLDVLSKIKANSIDLILADLPYGTTASDWDKIIPMAKLWPLYNNILKPDGSILLFAAQPFTTMLIQSNINEYKYCWYWIKNQATNFFHADKMPLRSIEEVVVFKNGRYYPQISTGHKPTQSAKGSSNGRVYHGENKRNYKGGKTTRYPNNVLNFKTVDNYSRIHPNEKPVNLLRYLIKTYTSKGDIVLDNVAGSGSTGIAAIKENRKFVLVDDNSEYVEKIDNRITSELRQPELNLGYE